MKGWTKVLARWKNWQRQPTNIDNDQVSKSLFNNYKKSLKLSVQIRPCPSLAMTSRKSEYGNVKMDIMRKKERKKERKVFDNKVMGK